MNRSYEELVYLLDAADRVYQEARVEIFDQVSISVMTNPKLLTPRQRDVLERLAKADEAVARFRAAFHGDDDPQIVVKPDLRLVPDRRARL